MINDTTSLRFYMQPNVQREVEVTHLAVTCDSLAAVATTATRTLGLGGPSGPRSCKLYIVADPRPGCIEFILRPELAIELDLTVQTVSSVLNVAPDESWREVLSDYASMGAFLWAALFGGKGLLDRRLAAREDPEALIAGGELRMALSETAARKPEVLQAMAQLVANVQGFGYQRIEIQVRDDPSVVIAASGERRQRGLIGSVAAKANPPVVSGPTLVTAAVGEPAVQVLYDQVVRTAFVGSVGGTSAVIVWGSTRPLPSGPIYAEGIFIDPYQLQPVDDLPLVYDRVPYAFYVAKAGDFS